LQYSCLGSAAPSCKGYSSHGLSVSEGFKLDIYIIIINGSLYGDMTAKVMTDKTTTTIFYGPDVFWDKFIQSQSQWLVCLLQDVHSFSDDGYSNVWEIVQELEQHGYLLAVSDGSVKFHGMSSGWVLATPTGELLAAAS
jgi:hypothetical protein